jgi:hypothetical protein
MTFIDRISRSLQNDFSGAEKFTCEKIPKVTR